MSAIYVDLVDSSSADSKSSNGGSSSSSAAEEVKKILDDVIENVTGVKKEKQQQHLVRSSLTSPSLASVWGRFFFRLLLRLAMHTSLQVGLWWTG